MNLTNVVFTFYDSKGVPIAETPFTIMLIRSGFDKQVGVVVPTTIEVETDINGTATVGLAPSSTPYYVQIEGLGHCGKQSYKFFVPESDVPLNFQDLIVIDELDPTVITEEKIRLIIEAIAVTKESAANAKISETNAKASEVNAKASEDAAVAAANSIGNAEANAAASAAAALVSETNAKASENASKASENSTRLSETTANASAIAAQNSEASAASSAMSANQDASTASQKAQEAVISASNAKVSEDNAAASDARVTALKGEVETTYQQNIQVKNDVQALLDQALAVGSGWSPVIKAVQDGADRCVLQIVDWTGGAGVKPAVGYIGLTGVVPTAGEAVNIQGANGADGSSFTVNATGPFSERPLHDNEQVGFAFLSTDTGLLYIREGAAGGWSAGIPFGKGDKGDKGERGEQGIQGLPGADSTVPGPANTLTIGTVTSGPISAANITGQSPNQVLNLTLQPGAKGDTGPQGAGWSQAQTDKLNGIATGATKNLPDATLLERSNQTGGFNGFGVMNTMRNTDPVAFSAPPSFFFGKGSFVGMVFGPDVGLPEMSYGTGRVDAHWTDISAGYAVMRTFEGTGSRRYTCYATSPETWSPWFETTHRANLVGQQSMDTVAGLGDALDAVMRVRRLEEATAVGFLDQMWHLGPGYYRNDLVNPITQIYSSGMFSKVADTWMYVSADRATGAPKFLAGTYPDIAAGTWKVFDFGSAAARNVQASVLDATSGRLLQVGAFGLGTLNPSGNMNLNSLGQFPTGRSNYYLNAATNGPYSDFYGYLQVDKVDDNYVQQTVSGVETGLTYKRTINAGNFQSWRLVIDSNSTVGTVVNGSVIESGTNANGSYVKFADGTMECRHLISLPGHAISTSAAATWNYPVQFYSIPISFAIPIGELGTGSQSAVGILNRNGLFMADRQVSRVSPSTYGYVEGRSSSVELVVFAKGRWKA